jgi:hypothetical protein
MANPISGEPMTPSTFIPTNATTLTPASNRRAPTLRAAANVGRIFRNPAAAICKAIVIIIAYRAALKRLEAGVEGNLFDEPVLWAELKSMAWAEAGDAADQWTDQLPLIGAFAFGVGLVLAISLAALWTL